MSDKIKGLFSFYSVFKILTINLFLILMHKRLKVTLIFIYLFQNLGLVHSPKYDVDTILLLLIINLSF